MNDVDAALQRHLRDIGTFRIRSFNELPSRRKFSKLSMFTRRYLNS